MTDRIFIDSNVWVYLFTHEDGSKCKVAEQFISENGSRIALVISPQVINEVTNVLSRKKFSELNIRSVIEQLSQICIVQDYSKDIALLASEIREKHSFSFWDSHIIASAITSQCSLLASEDMQDSRVIGGLTIRNIFKD